MTNLSNSRSQMFRFPDILCLSPSRVTTSLSNLRQLNFGKKKKGRHGQKYCHCHRHSEEIKLNVTNEKLKDRNFSYIPKIKLFNEILQSQSWTVNKGEACKQQP